MGYGHESTQEQKQRQNDPETEGKPASVKKKKASQALLAMVQIAN